MTHLRALLRGPGLGLLALACAAVAPAHAQTRQPDHTDELRLIESTERGEDPLGIDVATGQGLDEAAARLKPAAPPRPSPLGGAVLSAIPGVREAEHRRDIQLHQGLAFVRERLRFTSQAKHPAELALRLALPQDAVVTRLKLCRAQAACVEAGPHDASAARRYVEWLGSAGERGLGVLAELLEEEHGRALGLRIASLAPGEQAELELHFVTEAPLRGGRVRLELPARGEDPALVTSQVSVGAEGLSLGYPGTFEWLPSVPLEIVAELPRGARLGPTQTRARCGAQACTRSFEALGPEPPRARPTWLWIDASPSMEGPARGRVDAVLSALLAQLSGETDLSVHAFAARAELVGRFRADAAPLSALTDATLRDLDAATRTSSVLSLTRAELAAQKPLILILSDGRLDTAPKEQKALDQARARGAELWLVALGDEPPPSALAGHLDGVLQLSSLAEAALRGARFDALGDALRAPSSPHGARGLRTGEQRVREHAPSALYTPRAGDPWLAFWLARSSLPWLGLAGGAQASGQEPPIPALAYASRPAPAPPVHSAMPAESVLDMLRSQLVPRARACLRSDRKGRGDYAVELTFRALFARREVAEASVEGQLTEELRSCLEALLPGLKVPAFSGAVRVRYPIHTLREAPPPVIELTPDVEAHVSRALAAPEPRAEGQSAAVPAPTPPR